MPFVKKNSSKIHRTLVGILGGLLLVIGIIAIPYPGPGWAIVLGAFAILATEFEWAHHIYEKLKAKYTAWLKWVESQHLGLRMLLWTLTGAVVVLTIWLLNGYGYVAELFDISIPWLKSPLPWY